MSSVLWNRNRQSYPPIRNGEYCNEKISCLFCAGVDYFDVCRLFYEQYVVLVSFRFDFSDFRKHEGEVGEGVFVFRFECLCPFVLSAL